MNKCQVYMVNKIFNLSTYILDICPIYEGYL